MNDEQVVEDVEEEWVTLIGPCSISTEMHFTYLNWKGEVGERRAIFTSLQFGSNKWHKKPQLLLYGYDLDKKAPRTYAIKYISDLKLL